MIGLDVELLDAMDALDARAERWLLRRGVPVGAINGHPGPIGCATIETDIMGTYQPVVEGERVFVQPVWLGGEYSELADLIAWCPERPERCWTRRRAGEQLGCQHLDWAIGGRTPLIVHQTPLAWLASSGRGIAIVDWAAALPRLRQVPVLIAADEQHGVDLERRFAEPVLLVPEIRIPKLETV